MKESIVQSKTVLTKSGLPASDYVVNPYSGCAFGCVYCYADFTRRFQGHLSDKWGEYVDVRINAAEVFKKEIRSLNKKIISSNKSIWKNGSHPVVLLSSVCDPYQGSEAKYKITRELLKVCIEEDFQGEISILTKSPLVTRDIDLLKQLNRVNVGMTITSTDDKVSKLFEKDAPPASVRVKTLAKLNLAGLPTYVCVSPLLPHFVAQKERLYKLLKSIKDAGTDFVFIEHINLSGVKMRRLLSEIKDKIEPEIIEEILNSQTEEYKRKLEKIVNDIVREVGLEVWNGGVIDHEKVGGKTRFISR